MEGNFTFMALSENSPGILHRVTTQFTRRAVNIESLTVSETERKGVSRFTIVVKADRALAEKIARHLRRIIEVTNVYLCENRELIYREIGLIKVNSDDDRENRLRIEEIAHRYGAHVVFGGDGYLIVEKSGREEEIDSLFLLLEPFGIVEFVRSGRIALQKERSE